MQTRRQHTSRRRPITDAEINAILSADVERPHVKAGVGCRFADPDDEVVMPLGEFDEMFENARTSDCGVRLGCHHGWVSVGYDERD